MSVGIGKTQEIDPLFASGMTKRTVAWTVGIGCKSLVRHRTSILSNGPIHRKCSTGKHPAGSEAVKTVEDVAPIRAKSVVTIPTENGLTKVSPYEEPPKVAACESPAEKNS